MCFQPMVAAFINNYKPICLNISITVRKEKDCRYPMLSNIVILMCSVSDHCKAERTSKIRFLQGPDMTLHVKCIFLF